MTTYTVGYFVGSLSTQSINRTLSDGARPPGAAATRDGGDPDRRPAALQPGLDDDYPAAGAGAEGRDRRASTRCCS